MKITTNHLVLETRQFMGEIDKSIRKVYCVHTSTDRQRYIMETVNGRGGLKLKQISTEDFIVMSAALAKRVFSEDGED